RYPTPVLEFHWKHKPGCSTHSLPLSPRDTVSGSRWFMGSFAAYAVPLVLRASQERAPRFGYCYRVPNPELEEAKVRRLAPRRPHYPAGTPPFWLWKMRMHSGDLW